MKILKLLAFLILLVLIAGAIYFGAKDGSYDIQDSRTIAAPPAMVYNTINEYKTWEDWGPWKKEDPKMVFEYPEQTSGVGGSYSWKADTSMGGAMQTTAVEENKSIEQDLTLFTPGGERNPKTYWTFEPTAEGTKVVWGMRGEHTLIDKIFYTFNGFDFEGQMHEMNNNGFDGLETYLKSEMNKYEVSTPIIGDYGGGYYVYITSSTTAANMQPTMAQNYGTLIGFTAQNQIAMTGMPFTIYETFAANGGVIMSNALPVKNRVTVTGETNILCDYQKPTKAVLTVLKGNYEHLGEAWEAARQYITDNGLETSDQKPFEIYTNDPDNYPNPADWTTEIYIPIKE